MITTFTTRDGRQWAARFTDETERAAADELGVRLADLAGREPPRLVGYLRRRLDRLGGLLWLAVRDQAEARGVGPEQFAALFSAAHIPAAALALARAIADRYPESPLARATP